MFERDTIRMVMFCLSSLCCYLSDYHLFTLPFVTNRVENQSFGSFLTLLIFHDQGGGGLACLFHEMCEVGQLEFPLYKEMLFDEWAVS